MNDKNKRERIKARNQKIDNSIYISHGREKHEGFKLLEKQIRLLEQKYRFPDIFTLKKEKDPVKLQGKVEVLLELINFLDHADTMAYKKKQDPDSGEEEVLREEES